MINQKIEGTNITIIDYDAFSALVEGTKGKYTIVYGSENPSYSITIDGVNKNCNSALNIDNLGEINKRGFQSLASYSRQYCIISPIEGVLRYSCDTAFGKKGDEIKFVKDGGNLPDDILEIFGLNIGNISGKSYDFNRIGEGCYMFVCPGVIL